DLGGARTVFAQRGLDQWSIFECRDDRGFCRAVGFEIELDEIEPATRGRRGGLVEDDRPRLRRVDAGREQKRAQDEMFRHALAMSGRRATRAPGHARVWVGSRVSRSRDRDSDMLDRRWCKLGFVWAWMSSRKCSS